MGAKRQPGTVFIGCYSRISRRIEFTFLDEFFYGNLEKYAPGKYRYDISKNIKTFREGFVDAKNLDEAVILAVEEVTQYIHDEANRLLRWPLLKECFKQKGGTP